MKKIILILIFFCIFFTNKVNGEEIIFFYSNTCPYCDEVIEIIDNYNLKETLNLQMLESSEEGFQEIYNEKLDMCNIALNQGGYPTLYYENNCHFGKTNNINHLLELAGLEKVKGEKDDTEEDIEEEVVEEMKFMPRESLPIWMIFTMFIGPALFIYIVYLMIKKLNL